MKSPSSEVPASPRLNNSDIINSEADKEFKLAPTPAQLGKAPLQRRQSMGKCALLMHLYRVTFHLINSAVNSTTTVQNPENEVNASNEDNAGLVSPANKKSFFKKNVEDGMDRFLFS